MEWFCPAPLLPTNNYLPAKAEIKPSTLPPKEVKPTEFGCLHCHRKDRLYGGLMLCEKCRVTIYARRRRIRDRQARLRKRGMDTR